jgi:hypothetical protein
MVGRTASPKPSNCSVHDLVRGVAGEFTPSRFKRLLPAGNTPGRTLSAREFPARIRRGLISE